MGKFQAMHKYLAVFLALIACHASLLTHGRKMGKEDNLKPTFPSIKTSFNVPSPSLEKKVDSPEIPEYGVASFGDSVADTNAFRPTTPGNSPGVGHKKFAGENKDMKTMVVVQSPDAKVSMTEGTKKNDFRPTVPGNSPGAGHAHNNKIGQLN